MNQLFLIVIIYSLSSVSTVNSVDFERLKLGEIDNVWEKVQTASSRAFTTPSATTTNLNNPLEPIKTYGEFSSQNSLNDFLESYAEKLRKDKLAPLMNKEPILETENDPKDQKSWNLIDFRKNKYPTDERKDWVSLDPVPWSIAKVSKWKPKPTEQSWNSYHNQNHNPWGNDYDDNIPSPSQYQHNNRPEIESDDHKVYYTSNKNTATKESYIRPFTAYDQTIKSNYHNAPIKIGGFYRPQETFTQNRDGIIIDKNPPNFPTDNYDFNRRSGHEEKPQPHPFFGEGDWVLLSTTKGYKSPRTGQRSIDFSPKSISTKRSVQLTVLPPLKNSKINMTTSHGGLLQVDSTSESVEQAHRKYQKVQKNKLKKRRRLHGQIKRKKAVRDVSDSAVTTAPRSTDASAVLAAFGSGVIPSTMAMLVPMVNGAKRRKKREIFTTSDPRSNIQITLPRYYKI